MDNDDFRQCPHCGRRLSKWAVPMDSTWTDDYHWVCFNDECPYYVEGWDYMETTRGIKCSYRYMCGQRGQRTGPLSVPTPTMGRNMIIEDEDC